MKGIYLLTFPNSKIYIGQSIDIEKRFKQHINDSNLKKIRYVVSKAIKKYGWDNIKKDIIISGENLSREQLNGFEVFWIATYNSNDRYIGYNKSPGGRGQGVGKNNPRYGVKVSPEILERMKKASALKKKKISQFDLNNNFIRNWDSMKEAGESLKIYSSNINKACKGVKPHYKGFKWKYA